MDVIVDEAVRIGRIDRSQLGEGRIEYNPNPVEATGGVEGEGATDVPGFRRNPTTRELTAVRRTVEVGTRAFRHGVPWLYSSILHEYKHVLQGKTVSGLPTIEAAVPGQRTDPTTNWQQDVETYAEEIHRARETGVAAQPALLRILWHRLHHDNWINLGRMAQAPVRDVYIRAHAEAEAILGTGSLTNFRP